MKGRAVGKLLDKVSALLQAPRELRVQGHRACEDRGKGKGAEHGVWEVTPTHLPLCRSCRHAALAQSGRPSASLWLRGLEGPELNFYFDGHQTTQQVQLCFLGHCPLSESARQALGTRGHAHVYPPPATP